MAFVTYVLLSSLLAGLRGDFHTEVMGLTATAAFAVVLIEILGLKFGTYILSINNDSQLLDLLAYSGYKFVGVIVTLVFSEILNGGKGTGGWIGWTVFTYTFLANAFFLVSPPNENFSTCLDLLLSPSTSLIRFSNNHFFMLKSPFFQLRSLKYVLLPDSSSSSPAGSGMLTVARSQRNRRTQFLFLYSYVVQFIFMWILSRQDSTTAKAVGIKQIGRAHV